MKKSIKKKQNLFKIIKEFVHNNEKEMKKISLYSIIFFLSLSAIFTVFISIEAQKQNIYSITINGEKNKLSDSSEVAIKEIYIDQSKINFSTNKTGFTLEQGLLVGNAINDKPATFILKTSAIDNIKITLLKNNHSGKVSFKVNDQEQEIDLYSENDDEYQYIYSYRIADILINKLNDINYLLLVLIFLFSFIIISISCNWFINLIKKINSDKLRVTDIIKATIAVFVIFLSFCYLSIYVFKLLTIIPIVLVLIIGLYNIRNSIKQRVEYAFIYIAIIVGVSFIFILPHFHVPDEEYHFIRSYEMIPGKDKLEYNVIGQKAYIYLPNDLENIINKQVEGKYNRKSALPTKSYFYELGRVLDYNDLSDESHWFENTTKIPAISYIPATTIMTICKILQTPLLLTILLGKLIAFIIALIMCYYAIKITPRFKYIFFLVCLFPIFIQQITAFNVDWLNNSAFILLAALIFKQIYIKTKITTKEIVLIVLITIILSLCKTGYFLVLFLILLVPSKNFVNKKAEIFFKSFIILLGIIISAIVYFSMVPIDQTVGLPEAGYSLRSFFVEPIRIVEIYIETFKNDLANEMFGGLFSGFGASAVWHNNLNYFIISIVYLFCIFTAGDYDEKISIKHRISFGLVAFILLAAIYSALLVAWTPKDYSTVSGLQPRYFLPVVLLLYISLSNKYVTIKIKNRSFFYSVGIVIVYAISFFTIISHYYIK